MRPHVGTSVILAAALAFGAPVASALAAPGSADGRAALLPLQFEGDLNEGWRDQIEQDIGRGLVQAGVEVVDPKSVTKASGGVSDCDNAKCFQFLSTSVEARFLVRAKVVVEERNYEVTIDVIDGQSGSLAASSSESCQLCGLAEVGELVTKQAAVLRQKVDALALRPAMVAVTSEPSGATIWIDGVKIGDAPLEHELAPGSHRADARMRGFIDQSRTVQAVHGVRETVRFELLPAADSTRAAGGTKDWKVPTGWSLVGVGVAGTAAGVTFLLIDDDPYEARCSGPDVDPLGNCRQRYDTLAHGIAFTAAGGALLVTGAALLVAARAKRGRRMQATAQRLRIGPGTVGARF
jgi:hypothetical protein